MVQHIRRVHLHIRQQVGRIELRVCDAPLPVTARHPNLVDQLPPRGNRRQLGPAPQNVHRAVGQLSLLGRGGGEGASIRLRHPAARVVLVQRVLERAEKQVALRPIVEDRSETCIRALRRGGDRPHLGDVDYLAAEDKEVASADVIVGGREAPGLPDAALDLLLHRLEEWPVDLEVGARLP